MLCIPFLSIGEVVSSDKHGFKLSIEQKVNVDSTSAYLQFIDVSKWWNAEHTWFGNADALSIEPKVGGCFCEILADKQALHMTVSYVEPNKEMRMIGGLGPLQMTGINGGMSWKFEAIDENSSKIIFHYQVSGYIDGGLDKLAPIVNQVQSLQLTRLADLLNTGSVETVSP